MSINLRQEDEEALKKLFEELSQIEKRGPGDGMTRIPPFARKGKGFQGTSASSALPFQSKHTGFVHDHTHSHGGYTHAHIHGHDELDDHDVHMHGHEFDENVDGTLKILSYNGATRQHELWSSDRKKKLFSNRSRAKVIDRERQINYFKKCGATDWPEQHDSGLLPDEKLDQDLVEYSDARSVEKRCASCMFITRVQDPTSSVGIWGCRIVKGQIDPKKTCTFWCQNVPQKKDEKDSDFVVSATMALMRRFS